MHSNYDRLFRYLFFLLLVIGVVLRCYQYFMQRTLWEDECHLALNIMQYDYLRLTQPLDFIQGAPVLFLLLVKTAGLLFGYGELALRLVPFIIDLLTFPLFYFLVLHLTRNRVIATIAFLVLSTNVTLIYFSSELKPYAVDVSMYLLLAWLAVTPHSAVVRRRRLLLAVAGSLAILLSLSAFIVLFCIACTMIAGYYRNRRVNFADLKVLVPWAVVFLANYFLFIHNHPSMRQQQINYASAFCPTTLLSCEFVEFLRNILQQVFFDLTLRISPDHHLGYVLLLMFAAAILYFTRQRNYSALLLTCLPVLLHLLLSALKIYPFSYRLILYQTPALILLIATGTWLIADLFTRRVHTSLGIAVALICCFFLVRSTVRDYPMWTRDIKPALAFMNDSIPPPEHVYVFDPVNAYTYYHRLKLAEKPVYRALDWDMAPQVFSDLVADETANYLLLYSTEEHFGYDSVIRYLENKKVVVRKFSRMGYDVCEVKPLDADSNRLIKSIGYLQFEQPFRFEEDQAVVLWGLDRAVSEPFVLKKGRYRLSVTVRGTPALGVYPHNTVFFNSTRIGSFDATGRYEKRIFNLDLPADTTVRLGIDMDNDLTVPGKEDRNTFIRSFRISARH